jgi:hypothetical protein
MNDPPSITCKPPAHHGWKLEDAFENRWLATQVKAHLPASLESCYWRAGHLPLHQTNSRRYNQYYLRVKAILIHGNQPFGGYTMDLSRQGIGMLSPIEFKRADRIQVTLPNDREFTIGIVRCCKIANRCYECGGQFII